MPSFGFSAYLKLVSLSDTARRSSIFQRLRPTEGGYDFHRSLRLQASRLLDGLSLSEALAQADTITRSAERESVKTALTRLSLWRRSNTGSISSGHSLIYNSPSDIFSVNYNPNFSIVIGGFNTYMHIWNTQRPPLTSRQIYASLSLFRNIYREIENAPDDIGLLSLRNSTAYRLGEATDHYEIGLGQVINIENMFREISEELGTPLPIRKDGPRPSPAIAP